MIRITRTVAGRRLSRTGGGAVLAVTLLALGHGAVLAQGDADAARGIVSDYCVDCHEVPGYRRPEPMDSVNAPAFADIAAEPATYTDARLHAFLMKPHFRMRQLRLSARDIVNIIAFIKSLETAR